ncbi:MAG: tetratricopeptide repeat protein [Pseudomonadota bacterium]
MFVQIIRLHVICVFVLFLALPASAELRTFFKEYRYRASEADSKLSSRAIALEQVKRLLLEELGTYLESHTEVKNYQLTKDQITILTAGVVRTNIIEEKWDGKTYWLRAKITADPSMVAKSIDSLRKDQQKTRQLEATRKKANDALQEIEQLKRELSATKNNKERIGKLEQYTQQTNVLRSIDWENRGITALLDGDWAEGRRCFEEAITLDPELGPYGILGFVLLYNEKNYHEAIVVLRKFLYNFPLDVWTVRRDIGEAYLGLEMYDKAIKNFERALDILTCNCFWINVDSYDRHVDQLEKRIDAGGLIVGDIDFYRRHSEKHKIPPKFEAGLYEGRYTKQTLQERTDYDPKDAADLYFRIGAAYGLKCNENLSEEAILRLEEAATSALEKGLTLNPKHQQALTCLRGYYAEAYAYDKPLSWYNRAISLFPEEANGYKLRGKYFNKRLGNYEQAIEDLSKAIDIIVGQGRLPDPDLYFDRGSCNLDLENWDQALKDFNKAIELNPNNSSYYFRRGDCFLETGKYSLAISDYDHAMKLDPNNSSAYYNRGLAHARLGQCEAAIPLLKKAAHKDPNYPVYHLALGAAYDACGLYKEALRAYRQGLRSNSERPIEFLQGKNLASVYSSLGFICFRLNLYAEAEESFLKAIQINPDSTYDHLLLCMLYFKQGNKSAAQEQYKILKRLDGKFPDKFSDFVQNLTQEGVLRWKK